MGKHCKGEMLLELKSKTSTGINIKLKKNILLLLCKSHTSGSSSPSGRFKGVMFLNIKHQLLEEHRATTTTPGQHLSSPASAKRCPWHGVLKAAPQQS